MQLKFKYLILIGWSGYHVKESQTKINKKVLGFHLAPFKIVATSSYQNELDIYVF